MKDSIKTLLIRTDTEMAFHETVCLRGAVINAPLTGDVLYHNHVEGGFRYSYPLIQYKRIGGKAALLFIGDGIDKAAAFFAQNQLEVRFRDRTAPLKVTNISAFDTRMQLWQEQFLYTLRKYLPFNGANYESYRHAESVIDRCQIIQHTLVGNILSMAKGLGIHFDDTVEARITQLSEPRLYTYKGVRMMGFDLTFLSNVSLPDYIGLGKGASLGYGMIKRQKKEDTRN